MHRANVAAHELQIRARHSGQVTVREDPAWGVAVVGAPSLRVREEVVVIEHPLEGRGAHRHRADAGEEPLETLRTLDAVLEL
jgi:hypothetical protein